VLYGVRTFLDPDNAEPRSPNRPEAISSYTQGKGASTAIDYFENTESAVNGNIEKIDALCPFKTGEPEYTNCIGEFGKRH